MYDIHNMMHGKTAPIKLRYILIMIIVIVWAMSYMGDLDKQAMADCQIKHSYATCFNALHN